MSETSDALRLEYVPLDTCVLWERNPKLHDIGGIVQSIQRYGFKDPLKYEPTLNAGNGGLVEGNGRAAALAMMRDQGDEPPRGVTIAKEGGWAVPVLFGVDAESEAAAEAYAVDHNNLTLLGGDLTGFDAVRMWDAGYPQLLESLALQDVLPVSVDGDVLDALLVEKEKPVSVKEEHGDESSAVVCPNCGYSWGESA